MPRQTSNDAAQRIAAVALGDLPPSTLAGDCPSVKRRFYCTEDAGHPLPHIACGGEVVAMWDDDGRFVDIAHDGPGATL